MTLPELPHPPLPVAPDRTFDSRPWKLKPPSRKWNDSVLPPQSGLISVSLSVQVAYDVPWAQLYVYLLSGSDYCGQNLPDAPTWGFLTAGWTTTYTVTGFQVYSLPCDVTGVQVFFHTRNNGLLIPPPRPRPSRRPALRQASRSGASWPKAGASRRSGSGWSSSCRTATSGVSGSGKLRLRSHRV